MLVPLYNKFIFYVHNLGKFDVIFLQKPLFDYNQNVEDKYKLTPFYRNNQIIRLTVQAKVGNQIIKISFVDSLNLVTGSLDI